MTLFESRSLRGLTGIFGGFRGKASAPNDVDLTSVQLVADVLRVAGYGQAPGRNFGRTILQIEHLHNVAGGTEIITETDPYTGGTVQTEVWEDLGDRPDLALWMLSMGVHIRGAGGIFSSSEINILYPDNYIGVKAGVTTDDPPLRNVWRSDFESPINPGPTSVIPGAGEGPVGGYPYVPLLLPRGCSIQYSSLTTGTDANGFQYASCELLALPVGLTPQR